MQYKTVAGPIGLTIQKNDDFASAVGLYADIINREAAGGWKLIFIQEVPVTKNKGCLAGCLSVLGLGSAMETVTFNMLVFGKE